MVVLSGCLFGHTDATLSAKKVEKQANTDRAAAIAVSDYPAAVAYDDVFLVRNGAGDTKLRRERAVHFRDWLEAKVTAIGPPTGENLGALVGTLVAFRRESQRALGLDANGKPPLTRGRAEEDATKIRQEDLAKVDAERIMPRLVALAPAMWSEVAGEVKQRNLVHAVMLGRAIVAELPKNSPQGAQLTALEHSAAAVHVALASEVGDTLPGARMLHAQIAALFGTVSADLVAMTPALAAATGDGWKVSTSGSDVECGASIDHNITGTYDKLPFDQRMMRAGFAPSEDSAAPSVVVAFTTCPITSKSWNTEEDVPWEEIRKIETRRAIYEELCMPDTYKDTYVKSEDYTTHIEWKIPGGCSQVVTGSETEIHEVKVPHVERATIHHFTQTITLAGTIKIDADGASHAYTFSIPGTSRDDISYEGQHLGGRSRTGDTDTDARNMGLQLLITELRAHKREVMAARATEWLARAHAAEAAGKSREADHAFYVANELAPALAGGDFTPQTKALDAWVERSYHIPPGAMAAAQARTPLATIDVAQGYEVKVKPLEMRLWDDDELDRLTSGRGFREALTLHLSVGPTFTSTTGGTETKTGGTVGLTVETGSAAPLFGVHLGGGSLAGGHGFVDAVFIGGYGLSTHSLWLGPTLGLGGDFTTGSQDLTPTPDGFIIPPGFLFEYGARLHYAFPKNGSVAALYAKRFRTAEDLPREKIAELRFSYSGLGTPLVATYRYTEWLGDGDGFLTAFGADKRYAKTNWFLLGYGF